VTPPPLRRKLLSPTPSAPAPPASAWTPEKEKAVLDSFRSFVANAAKKHQLPPEVVAALVFDHLADPGD
jgi:ribonuclease D